MEDYNGLALRYVIIGSDFVLQFSRVPIYTTWTFDALGILLLLGQAAPSIRHSTGFTVGEAEIELTAILIGHRRIYRQWWSATVAAAAAAVPEAARRDCLVDGGEVSP